MTRAEINKKFDEIVAFAEVERFLDTPVKLVLIPGMYVRDLPPPLPHTWNPKF